MIAVMMTMPVETRLKPLYQGEHPLMSSRVVKGVRFVLIDNSVYHVLQVGRQKGQNLFVVPRNAKGAHLELLNT